MRPHLHFGQGADIVDRYRAGILVADSGAGLVGFANYERSRDADADPVRTGQIAAIYLLPEAWGTGTGRELMGAAVDGLAFALRSDDNVEVGRLDGGDIVVRRAGWLALLYRLAERMLHGACPRWLRAVLLVGERRLPVTMLSATASGR